MKNRIAILGTVGVPANYGGFETLAQCLVDFHGAAALESELVVYCSANHLAAKPETYGNAKLRYIRVNANGPQSLLYDAISLFDAVLRGDNKLLLLGVSGALFLPFVRIFSRARILTNIDGIEWKRKKWKGLAKVILRMSEWAAVRFSHCIIVDNQAIADYVTTTYNRNCKIIAYGGDHALDAEPDSSVTTDLPKEYALALCRIEPENNCELILEAFAGLSKSLVMVGNWGSSAYGRDLKVRYQSHPSITILDAVYDPSSLRAIRDRASMYVHGHSAGGTNPSLVEMMHFGIPVLAHGCLFNRFTTEEDALYFMNSVELANLIRSLQPQIAAQIGAKMKEIAQRRYVWKQIGQSYFDLLEG